MAWQALVDGYAPKSSNDPAKALQPSKAGKGAGKKGPNGSGTWHRGKGADEWTTGRRDDGAKKGGKKGSKGSKPDWHGDNDKGGDGSKGKGKGKGKGKSETRYCYDFGEQGHIGVNCPYKWPTALMKRMIKHHRGRASLKERTLKNSRAWRRLTKKESGAGLSRAESPGGEGELTHDQHSTTLLNHLLSRNAGGDQWTWKKVTVVVDSGAAENVMPRRMFHEMPTEETERSKN